MVYSLISSNNVLLLVFVITSLKLILMSCNATSFVNRNNFGSIDRYIFYNYNVDNENDISGLLSYIFEWNFGTVIIGVDSYGALHNYKEKEEQSGNIYSCKSRYNFGITPRIGYKLSSSLIGYFKFGMNLSYTDNRFMQKRATVVGVGVEKKFGTFFVRGELNKMIDKKSDVVNNKKNNALKGGTYIIKIGSGYRF